MPISICSRGSCRFGIAYMRQYPKNVVVSIWFSNDWTWLNQSFGIFHCLKLPWYTKSISDDPFWIACSAKSWPILRVSEVTMSPSTSPHLSLKKTYPSLSSPSSWIYIYVIYYIYITFRIGSSYPSEIPKNESPQVLEFPRATSPCGNWWMLPNLEVLNLHQDAVHTTVLELLP